MARKLQSGARRVRAMACVLLLVALLFVAPSVSAQSCSMCYESAKQQNAEAARALNTGILVLLLPSLLLFGGVIATAMRRREQADEE